MIDECYIKTLLNDCEGYPKDMADLFGDEVLDFWYNGAVFDLDNEVIVKVSENWKILTAYNGFTKLTGK